MHLAVRCRSARFYVGDIKQVGIRATGKADFERLAYSGMRAIAARQVGGLAHFQLSAGPLQAREHTIARVIEVEQLRATLDLDAELGEPIDQQLLVLVLWKDERIGIWTDAHAHVAKHCPCHLLT